MPDYAIASVVRATRVLNTIGQLNRSVTLTEIARTTQIPKETVFRLLHTLLGCGYVQQAGDRWLLGVEMWGLVNKNLSALLADALADKKETP